MSAAIFHHEKVYAELYNHCKRIPICSSIRRQQSSATAEHRTVEQRDLYRTLGVEQSATAKEIKAAYYQLSKIYHPDRHDNEEQKRVAAEKFLQVSEAYEILSSDQKRKAYDRKCQERCMQSPAGSWPTEQQTAKVKKNFEDLGLDYRTFEEFQRSVNARRQRTRHDHWQMPDEFFANFGSSREFSSTFRPRPATYFAYSYKDAMQRERELKEWKILKEIEEEKRRSKYKTPAFVVMERERKQRELSEKRTVRLFVILFGGIVLIAYMRRL